MGLWHRWAAAIAIGAVGLAAWVGAGRAQAPKAQWVVAIGEEGESLDPPTSMLFTSEIYQQHLFDCLVGIEGEEFKPVGLLAEKWETLNPTRGKEQAGLRPVPILSGDIFNDHWGR